MPQSVLNSAAGHMPDSDSDGGSYIEEPRNPMAVDGGGSSLIPQACQRKARISVGRGNGNSMGGGLRKYRGVTRSGGKWTARASKKTKKKSEKSKNRVHLGTFPTAQMAAIAFDAAVLVLRRESRANRLNFPEYSAHIKSILEGFSPSDIANNMKYVASKVAKNIASLLSLENKDRDLRVSPLITQQPKNTGFDVSAPMPAAAISTSSSASLMSSDTGKPDSIPNADFTIVPVRVKQRIKVAARAAGRARQVRKKFHCHQQDTVNHINEHIQHEQPINDSGISSFSVMQDPEHECSNPVDTAKNNVNNEKIQHGRSTSNTLGGAADSGISSFSLASVQEPEFPISNPNSMPKRVESFDELIDVEKDYYMPNCVLLGPAPWANSHPHYLWKK